MIRFYKMKVIDSIFLTYSVLELGLLQASISIWYIFNVLTTSQKQTKKKTKCCKIATGSNEINNNIYENSKWMQDERCKRAKFVNNKLEFIPIENQWNWLDSTIRAMLAEVT